jgi:hypothetical protein
VAADSRAELSTDVVTVAEAMRSGGYATGFFGMWNLGRGRTGPVTRLGRIRTSAPGPATGAGPGWLPLGVFSVVAEGDSRSHSHQQLAVDRDALQLKPFAGEHERFRFARHTAHMIAHRDDGRLGEDLDQAVALLGIDVETTQAEGTRRGRLSQRAAGEEAGEDAPTQVAATAAALAS